MARAAVPLIASYFGSTLVSKIGESQGWDPRFTAIASIAAGAGFGSVGAGVGAASGAAGGATNAFNPATTGVMAGRALPTTGITSSLVNTTPVGIGGIKPHVSSGFQGGTRFGGKGIWQAGTSVPADEFVSTWATPVEQLSGIGLKSADPTGMMAISPSKQERFMAGMKDAWSDTWKDEKFITSLGTTFVDGMFAEPEKKQALSGGGGGGGGGSAPAYQGGQGGQYQLLVGFPQKATGPQWKEVA